MTLGPVSVSTTAPEQGHMVRVRGQHWVVSEVLPSSLPPDVLSGRSQEPHTLVRLSNVEDHGLGFELEVIWESEPGRQILASATLPVVEPGTYDEPARLAAFLDAVRWGAVTSADAYTLQAPFRSGITIEDYQLDPVVRALRTPRVNQLIADDVGLGKTIEAGLVAQELSLRHRARSIMIICPADLCSKWQREMSEKFGMDFTIIDSAALKELRRTHGIYANPWRVYPRTIVSLPWLRGERAQRLLAEALPVKASYPRQFDLMILDEAHHCAPSGNGHYAVDSQQTKAIRRLTPHFEHHLFLTATPHNGYRESFTALLELLDPQRFTRGVEPRQELLAEAMIRRVKDDIRDWDGSPRFKPRRAEALEVDYPEAELEVHGLLADYTRLRTKRLRTKAGERASDMITLLLKKRLFSSPAAFAFTVDVHAESVNGRSEHDYSDYDEVPEWLEEAHLRADEDFGDDEALGDAESDLLAQAARVQPGATSEEKRLLAEMQAWCNRQSGRADAKAERLLAWLDSVVRPDGTWNDERVVIFTEYRDTQKWLANLLEAHGLGGNHLKLLYGGQDDIERDHIKEAFQAPPDRDAVRILLATDSASEGIDLQLHCHRLVNYDIPFNPNRLEQRIGRLDRYKQKQEVEVRHFVGKGWQDADTGSYEKDLEFLSRVAHKVATIREDLGKVNTVLSAAVEQHMTGRGTRNIDAITPTPSSQLLKLERDLREAVQRHRSELSDSVETLRVAPDNIERVVRTALIFDRQADLQPGPWPGTFTVPALTGSWATTTVDLPDRLTGKPRPITFDQDVAIAHGDDVVLAHLGHHLVAMATRLLRAEVWGTSNSGLARVATARIPDHVSDGAPVLAAYSRLVLVGDDGQRLHEEVFAAGGVIRDGKWERLGVGDANKVLNEALDSAEVLNTTTVADKIAEGWERWQRTLQTAIDNRARERFTTLSRSLEQRRDADIERITGILRQLEATLRAEIDREPPEQLSLFDADELNQYHRDIEAWKIRIAEIPAEIERETEQIRARYATARYLTFPAAVVVCVPNRLAGGTA